VRNAREHAAPAVVRVTADAGDGVVRQRVADDGRGFSAEDRAGRRADGHVGLQLLEDLVREAGGTLALDSRPGHGTTMELELPA
jgi:signal transduction histidine kinase